MPRIAKPASLDAFRAREALKSYLRRKSMSANALARAVGVGQPTVSRFLSGRTKTLTAAVRPLLDYAEIDYETGITEIDSLFDNPRVRDALERFWDGRPESAELLARLLDALGPILRSTSPTATRRML